MRPAAGRQLLRPGDSIVRLADIWSLFKEAASEWIDDYAPSMGAAIAY